MRKQTSDVGAGQGSRRAASARALGWAVSLSLALHLVLTPVAAWMGVFSWLFQVTTEEDTSEAEQLRSIPFTWLGEEEEAEPEPESSAAAPALTAPVALTEAPSAPTAATRAPAAASPEKTEKVAKKPPPAAGRPGG